MFVKRKNRTENQRSFNGVGSFDARKIDLVTKLLKRHKRIKTNASPESLSSSLDGSGLSRSSPTSLPKKNSVVKNIVTRGLRRKREEVARTLPANTASKMTPTKALEPPTTVVADNSTPDAVSPIADDSPIKDTTMAQRSASFTNRRRHPMDRDTEFHNVIEAAISNNLMSNFDAIDHPSYRDHRVAPAGKPRFWVVGAAITVVVVCSVSMVLMNFTLLPTIACLVTMTLSIILISQDASLDAFPQIHANRHVVACEDEAWSMANSHLRSRILAANTILLRRHIVKVSLDELLIRNKSCTSSTSINNNNNNNDNTGDMINSFRRLTSHSPKAPPSSTPVKTASQAMAVHRKWAKNMEEIERRMRNEVLLIVSKALLVSNKQQRSSRTVLNSLGIEVMISRLQKMESIDFDPQDFHQLLEQYGHTEQAICTLYQLIMDKKSMFIKYVLLPRKASKKIVKQPRSSRGLIR